MSSITWRTWVYDRDAIEWEWVFQYGDQRSGTKGLLSWDSIEKRVVGAGVAPIGGMIRVTAENQVPFRGLVEGKMPDGTVLPKWKHSPLWTKTR